MQPAHKVRVPGSLVEGVPTELIGNVVHLCRSRLLEVHGLPVAVAIRGLGRGRLEGRVRAAREDAVKPCLLVLVSGRREGGAGELLSVETVWRLLWGVLADRQGIRDSLGSVVGRNNPWLALRPVDTAPEIAADGWCLYLLEVRVEAVLVTVLLLEVKFCDRHYDAAPSGQSLSSWG